MAVGFFAFNQGEEFVLDAFGDGAARAHADFHAVDGADRGDFNRSAAEEDFIGDVEHFARNDLFGYGNAEVFADGEDGVARDSRQRGIGQRWSDDRVAGDDENIFAGAFADVAVGIERDAFDVAVGARFHADELGIHVIGGALGHLRQSVGRGTIPRADANVHAIAQAFFT